MYIIRIMWIEVVIVVENRCLKLSLFVLYYLV